MRSIIRRQTETGEGPEQWSAAPEYIRQVYHCTVQVAGGGIKAVFLVVVAVGADDLLSFCVLTIGTMMVISKRTILTATMAIHYLSMQPHLRGLEERRERTLAVFHYIFFRTQLAPLRNDCADTAKSSRRFRMSESKIHIEPPLFSQGIHARE